MALDQFREPCSVWLGVLYSARAKAQRIFRLTAQDPRWLLPLRLLCRHNNAGRAPNRLVLHLRINQPTKKAPFKVLFTLAASPGLEPRLTESESAVLPLDDEALNIATGNKIFLFGCQHILTIATQKTLSAQFCQLAKIKSLVKNSQGILFLSKADI